MFIRDAFTAAMVPQRLDQTLGAVAASTTDARFWYSQLHAVALAIYQAQRRAESAKAAGALDLARSEVENVTNLRRSFQDVNAKFHAAMEVQDPTAADAVDRIILATGTWVEGFMQALPGGLAAVPNAVLDAAGIIGMRAGVNALAISVPLVGLGLLALWLLARAEKSPTVRGAVATFL